MTTIEIANILLHKSVKGLTVKDITYENDYDDKPTYGKAFIEISKDYLMSHSTPMYREIYRGMKSDSLYPWNGPPENPNYPDIRIVSDFAESINNETFKEVRNLINYAHQMSTKLRFRHLTLYFGPYEGFFEEPSESL